MWCLPHCRDPYCTASRPLHHVWESRLSTTALLPRTSCKYGRVCTQRSASPTTCSLHISPGGARDYLGSTDFHCDAFSDRVERHNQGRPASLPENSSDALEWPLRDLYPLPCDEILTPLDGYSGIVEPLQRVHLLVTEDQELPLDLLYEAHHSGHCNELKIRMR